MNSIRVLSPATTANLGPGFDCLGMSLDLWNSLEVIPGEPDGSAPLVDIIGEGEGELAADRSNLVYRAMEFLFREADENLPPLRLVCHNKVPARVSAGLPVRACASATSFPGWPWTI